MTSVIRPALTLYFLVVVAYSTWGTIVGRGLPGYFTSFLLSKFDWSSDELVGNLTVLLFLLPVLPLRKYWQAEGESAGRYLLYLVLILTPVTLGFWGRSHLIAMDREEQALVMKEMDKPDPLGLDSKNLLRLKGAYLVDAALRYSKEDYGEEHTLYVPLVSEDFEGEDIAFVLVLTQTQTPPSFLPGVQGQPYRNIDQVEGLVPVTFEGLAIRENLPVYCEEEWAKAGLHLSQTLYRLEARQAVDGKLPTRLAYLKPDLAAYLGCALGFALFLGFSLGEWKRGR